MTNIALAQGAHPIRAKEIAEKIKCPSHYVSKVLRKLVTSGLLKAEKGHGGGFILARPANKIFFSEILQAVQEGMRPKQCIFGWRRCDSNEPCILHNGWDKVSTSFVQWTRETSLADIQSDAQKMNWLNSDVSAQPIERRKTKTSKTKKSS